MIRCLVAILVSASLAAGEAGAATTFADLRAAAEARRDRSAAIAAWDEERQRLETAIASAARDTTEAEAATARIRDEIAALRREDAVLGGQADLAPVRTALDAGAQRLAARLRELEAGAAPDAIALPRSGDEDAFGAVAGAVEQSERALTVIALATIEGDLDGAPLVVRALRVGGACAWWLSLDGRRGGTVSRSAGRTVLRNDDRPEIRAAIAQAIAIADGRAPSGLVVLPLPGGAP